MPLAIRITLTALVMLLAPPAQARDTISVIDIHIDGLSLLGEAVRVGPGEVSIEVQNKGTIIENRVSLPIEHRRDEALRYLLTNCAGREIDPRPQCRGYVIGILGQTLTGALELRSASFVR